MKRLLFEGKACFFSLPPGSCFQPYRRWLITLLLLAAGQAGFAQQVKMIGMPDLEKVLNRKSDTTYVVNFWASWCGPCLQELPYFDQLNTKYPRHQVKVILVNLDVASKLEGKVKPLLQKKKIRSAVLLLNEPDQNTWISQIDKDWSGALPFTIFLNNNRNKRKTFEQAFTQAELESELSSFMD